MAEVEQGVRIAGRWFNDAEIDQIAQLVRRQPGASRFGLARQVCELTQWRRSNGALKLRECRDLLEEMERRQMVTLPAKRRMGRRPGQRTQIPLSLWGVAAARPLRVSLEKCLPIKLRWVQSRAEHAQWRELIGRYHYLGCATAYGAKLRYLAVGGDGTVLGCMEYASAAWKLAPRDQWIGWSESQRRARLGYVIQHSRFLILPWIEVRHLASHLLGLSLRVAANHWQERYALRPVLAETMVDAERFAGTCYRAANWIYVGDSQGRGRRDQYHQRHGAAPKRIFVYALSGSARRFLCG